MYASRYNLSHSQRYDDMFMPTVIRIVLRIQRQDWEADTAYPDESSGRQTISHRPQLHGSHRDRTGRGRGGGGGGEGGKGIATKLIPSRRSPLHCDDLQSSHLTAKNDINKFSILTIERVAVAVILPGIWGPGIIPGGGHRETVH